MSFSVRGDAVGPGRRAWSAPLQRRGLRSGPLTGALAPLLITVLVWSLAGCTAPAHDAAGVRVSRSGGADAGYHGTVPAESWSLPAQTFTDSSGGAYNLATTPSRPVTLVFFGYTHCPDVCTGVLSDLAMALDRADPAVREEVQVVFITTDPRRDTPQVIRAYLNRFDPDFVGLTGRPTDLVGAADALGVNIAGTRALPGGGYDVSHSAQLIGFDKFDRAAVQWTPGTTVGDLRADLTVLVHRQR